MTSNEEIDQALDSGRRITLKSHTLRESGERVLESVVKAIFKRYRNDEMLGPVYASVRELVQNASKANLKRVLFEELSLNPRNEEEYQRGMEKFRQTLVEARLAPYGAKIKERGLFFTVSLDHSPEVVVATVRNFFPLFEAEELRIREKFVFSNGMDNLYEFFMTHADPSEGAGMGIAMIEILLNQAGNDRHNFTIYTNERKETVAKIVVPLSPHYVSPRMQFEKELANRGVDAAILRSMVHSGEIPLIHLPSRKFLG